MGMLTDFLLTLFGTFLGLILSFMVVPEKDNSSDGTNKEPTTKNVSRRLKMSKPMVIGITIVLFIFVVSSYRYEHKENKENNERNTTADLAVCKEFYKNGDYDNALSILLSDGISDAKSNMVFAYFLANGYGIEKDIPLSIQYFTAAREMGDPRAETNMIISIIKNCYTDEKIDIIKAAYFADNDMAIRYVEFVVDSWNSAPENQQTQLTAGEIWSFDDDTLLSLLNGPFYRWVGAHITYKTSVDEICTDTYTRKFLYQIGTGKVYEECQLVVSDDFPSWLQEDIW